MKRIEKTMSKIEPALDKKYKKSEIELADIFRLRNTNKLSWSEIAKIANTSIQNIQQRHEKFIANLPNAEDSELYQKERVELLSRAELTLLKHIFDEKKLAKASINNIAYAFSQIFQARRLESNQSNINISIAETSNKRRKLEQEIESIEQELAKLSKP